MSQSIGKHGGGTAQSAANAYVQLARRYGLVPSETPAHFEPPSGYDHPTVGRLFVSTSSAEVQAKSAQAVQHAELE